MVKHATLCLVCGEEVIYSEKAFDVRCVYCATHEKSNMVCTAGHYVCDRCHREEGLKFIMDYCRKTDSDNPIEIITDVMSDKSIYANGPEHHSLFGAALIAAYANAGGLAPDATPINKEAALDEMFRRSAQLPGGTCGYWGVCSAATSVGQALSILNGATPMKDTSWAQCQALTSEVLGKLAELGGPRCCKRNGFTAVLIAIRHIAMNLGVHLKAPEKVVCSFFSQNKECKRMACPYFPASVRSER